MVGEFAERIVEALERRFPGRILDIVNDAIERLAETAASLLASVPGIVVALVIGLLAWRGRRPLGAIVAIISVHIAWLLGPRPELFDTVAFSGLVGVIVYAAYMAFAFAWATLGRRAGAIGHALRRRTPHRRQRSWLRPAFAVYLGLVVALGALAIQGTETRPLAALAGAGIVLVASPSRAPFRNGQFMGDAFLAALLIVTAMDAAIGVGIGGLLVAFVATGQIAPAVEVTVSALAIGIVAASTTGREQPTPSGSVAPSSRGVDRHAQQADGPIDRDVPTPGPRAHP